MYFLCIPCEGAATVFVAKGNIFIYLYLYLFQSIGMVSVSIWLAIPPLSALIASMAKAKSTK